MESLLKGRKCIDLFEYLDAMLFTVIVQKM
jgi:hypothetical protein